MVTSLVFFQNDIYGDILRYLWWHQRFDPNVFLNFKSSLAQETAIPYTMWNSTEFYINKLLDHGSHSKTREELEYFQSNGLLSLLPVFVVWFSGLIISGLALAQEVFIDVNSKICNHFTLK